MSWNVAALPEPEKLRAVTHPQEAPTVPPDHSFETMGPVKQLMSHLETETINEMIFPSHIVS